MGSYTCDLLGLASVTQRNVSEAHQWVGTLFLFMAE